MSIPATRHWQPARTGIGYAVGLEDIQQSFDNILTTPIGSNPNRPWFGSNVHLYLDLPLEEARPHLVRESVDALRKWEKRTEITRVEVFRIVEQTTLRIWFKLADGIERFLDVKP